MPTYSYRCSKCEATFDVRNIRVADMDRPQPCECGAAGVRDFGATVGAMDRLRVSFRMDPNHEREKLMGDVPNWIPPSAGGTTVTQDPRTGKLQVTLNGGTRRGHGRPGAKMTYNDDRMIAEMVKHQERSR